MMLFCLFAVFASIMMWLAIVVVGVMMSMGPTKVCESFILLIFVEFMFIYFCCVFYL